MTEAADLVAEGADLGAEAVKGEIGEGVVGHVNAGVVPRGLRAGIAVLAGAEADPDLDLQLPL